MDKLDTNKKYIAIFAGGVSATKIHPYDLALLQGYCYTVAINLYRHIVADVRVWTDKEINEVLHKICIEGTLPTNDALAENIRKTKAFLCRKQTFKHKPHTKPLQNLNIHYFNRERDGFKDNWTAWTAIQLFRKYMPDKTIMLFGYDCKPDYTVRTFGDGGNIQETNRENFYTEYLNPFRDKLKAYYNTFPELFRNVINCSPDTTLDFLPCQDWRAVIKSYSKLAKSN